MAALVASEVLAPDGHWSAAAAQPEPLAAVPTALVFRFTRSFLWATVSAMLRIVALRNLLG